MSDETLLIPVQRDLNVDVPSGEPPRNRYDVHTYSRLSAFHMPHSVEVTTSDANECLFRFLYANDEPVDRKERSLPNDQNVRVFLGRNSFKIVAIRLTDA